MIVIIDGVVYDSRDQIISVGFATDEIQMLRRSDSSMRVFTCAPGGTDRTRLEQVSREARAERDRREV